MHHQNRSLEDTQRNAWCTQIELLKNGLAGIDGHIYFEFSIPRMGRRVDNILIIGDKIIVLEFKIGSESFHRQGITQVVDYALDLKNFHAGSHDKTLIPVLLAEHAPNARLNFPEALDLKTAVCLNKDNFAQFIRTFDTKPAINPSQWE